MNVNKSQFIHYFGGMVCWHLRLSNSHFNIQNVFCGEWEQGLRLESAGLLPHWQHEKSEVNVKELELTTDVSRHDYLDTRSRYLQTVSARCLHSSWRDAAWARKHRNHRWCSRECLRDLPARGTGVRSAPLPVVALLLLSHPTCYGSD